MNQIISALLAHLHANGMSATTDEDGDIAFTHNSLSYVLCLDPEDLQFGCLMMPGVWHITDVRQARLALAALNDINGRLKLVKGVMDDRQVSFIIELWLPDPAAWCQFVDRARDILVHAVHLLVDAMQGNALPAQSDLQSPLGENRQRT